MMDMSLETPLELEMVELPLKKADNLQWALPPRAMLSEVVFDGGEGDK